MNHTKQEFREALSTQDRVGRRLAACLDEPELELGGDIRERLRFARERAVARASLAARQSQLAWAAPGAAQSVGAAWAPRPLALAGGAMAGWGTGGAPEQGSEPAAGWLRWIGGLLPLLIVVLGFLAIQDLWWERQIDAAAEVDTALLSDDLPPQAYSDPGFAEFLRRQGR